MIPLEFVNTHEHIIEEEKPLEQVSKFFIWFIARSSSPLLLLKN